MSKQVIAAALALGLVGALCAPAYAADKPVYMETLNTEAATLSVIATAGDTIGGYLIPGTPDGLGAYKTSTGIQILLNHEFSGPQSAISRGNGAIQAGSLISTLSLNNGATAISSATEAIKKVTWFDYATGKYGAKVSAPEFAAASNIYGDPLHTNVLNRFCSASLAAAGTFLSGMGKSQVGYSGAVYLTGEEDGDESRAFAMNLAGELVQLPRLGLASFETFNAAKTTSTATVLLGNEDNAANNSEVRLYVGKKNNKGTWFEKAGLTNGKLYFVQIPGSATDTEFRANVGKGKPTAIEFKQSNTNENGVLQNGFVGTKSTGFTRVEDGAFDPLHPNDYYFLTTESNGKATNLDPANKDVTKRDGGALWRIRFKNVNNPLAGATIEMLLDGSEAPYMNKPDNLAIDAKGNILIQEDPGNNAQVARVFAYRIADQKLVTIAKFKDVYFAVNGASKMTIDEESSGVLDVTSFLKKDKADTASYFLLDAQVHASPAIARPDITDVESIKAAVEGGQLYVLTITDWSKIYG